jgi:hypothetical protein
LHQYVQRSFLVSFGRFIWAGVQQEEFEEEELEPTTPLGLGSFLLPLSN